MPGCDAPQGLGKKERMQDSKKGGAVRLVFINAYAVPENFQPAPNRDISIAPTWVKVEEMVSKSLMCWSYVFTKYERR